MTIVGKIRPEGNINLSLIGVCKEKETIGRKKDKYITSPTKVAKTQRTKKDITKALVNMNVCTTFHDDGSRGFGDSSLKTPTLKSNSERPKSNISTSTLIDM